LSTGSKLLLGMLALGGLLVVGGDHLGLPIELGDTAIPERVTEASEDTRDDEMISDETNEELQKVVDLESLKLLKQLLEGWDEPASTPVDRPQTNPQKSETNS